MFSMITITITIFILCTTTLTFFSFHYFLVFSNDLPPKYAPTISISSCVGKSNSYFIKKPAAYTNNINISAIGLTFWLSHDPDCASASHLLVTASISARSISRSFNACSLSTGGKVLSFFNMFLTKPSTPLSGTTSSRLFIRPEFASSCPTFVSLSGFLFFFSDIYFIFC